MSAVLIRILSFCCLVCLSVGSSIAAQTSVSNSATKTATDLIRSMHRAAIDSSYKGTFMFSRGAASSSMRVVHRFHKGEEQERLTQLDGEMGEILRRGSSVMCLVAGNVLVQLDNEDFKNPVKDRFAAFMPGHEYYELKVLGYERVVDRPSVKLGIQSKDKLRYSYALWLDKSTSLLLKSELIGLNHEVLERFQFSMLELPAKLTDQDFEFDLANGEIKEHSVPMSHPDNKWPERLAWTLTWLPDGFMPMTDGHAKHNNVMLYSDGLASYSVFVEKMDKLSMPEGASMVGATVAYTKKLSNEGRNYTVTVVGEVPAMTAMKVADGVMPVMRETP